jgi:hypothetical protein
VETNKKQVVQPEVSRIKFDKEIAEFLLIEDDWRKKGVICLKANFPTIEFIFIAPHTKPQTVAFGVSIDFTNYDIEPPSIVFVNPFTLEPVVVKDMQVGFFQVVNQTQQIQGLPQQFQMQVPNQILMQGLNDRPFLCIPGIREYHNHPAHTDNPWLNHRTRGEGKLFFVLSQLYNHCIPHITGFNMQVNFSLKQF